MSVQRNIKLLGVFNFLVDFNLFSPVAVIYFERVTGSYIAAMSVFSALMISSAIFEVPTGIWSDMVGRKKTIIAGAIAAFLSVLALALEASYAYLLISATLMGLSRALYSGNNNAFLYDTLKDMGKEREYHSFLGKTSSMFQVALAVGALIGSILAHISFSILLWLSVLPKLINVFLALRFVEPTSHKRDDTNIFAHTKEALVHFKNNMRLRNLSLASIISFALGESSFQFRAAFFNTLWPLWAVGIARMLSNIGAAASYYFSGRIIKRFKEGATLIYGLLYTRFINIVSLAFPTIASPAIMSTTSLTYGVNEVAKDHLFQQEFTDKQRATMSSLNSLAGSVLFAVVSLGLGILADIIGPAQALIIVQILNLSVVTIYWRLFRTSNNIAS